MKNPSRIAALLATAPLLLALASSPASAASNGYWVTVKFNYVVFPHLLNCDDMDGNSEFFCSHTANLFGGVGVEGVALTPALPSNYENWITTASWPNRIDPSDGLSCNSSYTQCSYLSDGKTAVAYENKSYSFSAVPGSGGLGLCATNGYNPNNCTQPTAQEDNITFWQAANTQTSFNIHAIWGDENVEWYKPNSTICDVSQHWTWNAAANMGHVAVGNLVGGNSNGPMSCHVGYQITSVPA